MTDTTTLPPEAVEAAARALHRPTCDHYTGGLPECESRALTALAAALPALREQLAQEVEAMYLGPDFGRSPDGRESPDAHRHHAYDEGLETAARIVRGSAR